MGIGRGLTHSQTVGELFKEALSKDIYAWV